MHSHDIPKRPKNRPLASEDSANITKKRAVNYIYTYITVFNVNKDAQIDALDYELRFCCRAR